MRTPGTSLDNVSMLQVSQAYRRYVHNVCRRSVGGLTEFEDQGLRQAFRLEIAPQDAFDFLGRFES